MLQSIDPKDFVPSVEALAEVWDKFNWGIHEVGKAAREKLEPSQLRAQLINAEGWLRDDAPLFVCYSKGTWTRTTARTFFFEAWQEDLDGEESAAAIMENKLEEIVYRLLLVVVSRCCKVLDEVDE